MKRFSALFVYCLVLGCSTGDKTPSLRYNHNETTEEPRLQKVVSRFCDSAYIALNQTYEQSSFRILDIYDTFKQLLPDLSAHDWSELSMAQMVSAQPFDSIAQTLGDLKKDIPDPTTLPERIDLTKVAVVTENSADKTADLFKAIQKTTQVSSVSATAMTKAALFADVDAKSIGRIYEDFKIRLDRDADELTLSLLTSTVLISGKSTHELVKNYDSALKQLNEKNPPHLAAELVQLASILRVTPESVSRSYQKVSALKKPEPLKKHDLLILKLSLLSKETPEKILKSFTRVHQKDTPAPVAILLLIGEALKNSLLDQSESDECHGAYIRFILSFDRFRLD